MWQGVFPAVTTKFLRDGTLAGMARCFALQATAGVDVTLDSRRVRFQRLPLSGAERERVEDVVEKALACRPQLH